MEHSSGMMRIAEARYVSNMLHSHSRNISFIHEQEDPSLKAAQTSCLCIMSPIILSQLLYLPLIHIMSTLIMAPPKNNSFNMSD